LATNGFAEMELHRDRREGKIMGLVVKYWHWIIRVNSEKRVAIL
jgi:hypothetical protein